ncbi:MAG: NfeD family protein [Chthonomonadales bacterium]
MTLTALDIVFWSCLALGTAYTLVTVLSGSLGHAMHHVGHVAHSIHVTHAHHIPSGEATHGHVHGHADAAHGDQHTADSNTEAQSRFNILNFLNPMAVASFLLGFGGVGVIARMLGTHQKPSLLFAAAAGWGLWLVSYLIVTRIFGNAEGTSHNTWADVIGLPATVTVPIQGLKSGTVAYVVGGTRQTARAVCDDEDLIPTGSTVRIKTIANHTATVVRID